MKFYNFCLNYFENKKKEIALISNDIANYQKLMRGLDCDWTDKKKEKEFTLKYNDIENRIWRVGFFSFLFGVQYDFLRFCHKYRDIHKFVSFSNAMYLSKAKEMYRDFLINFGLDKLNQAQLDSIFIDDCFMQVVARAGCGKTSTLIGKIKFLLEIKNISKDEIKVISFNNLSVNDVKQRLSDENIEGIEPQTFHKFAKDNFGENRNIAKYNKNNNENILLNEEVQRVLNYDNKTLKNILYSEMLYCHSNVDKNVSDDFIKNLIDENIKNKYEIDKISTKDDTKDLLDTLNKIDKRLFTLNMELVRSKEEVFIANFLYLHKIKYVYEPNYFKDKSIEEAKFDRYFPDFYLVDYDIYLEHFGVSLKKDIQYCESNFFDTCNYEASWLNKTEEEKYIANITDKRELHKHFGTKLIESYSFFNTNDKFYDNLYELLSSNGVKLSVVDDNEAKDILLNFFKHIETQDKLKAITKIYYKFIDLFKSNGFKKDKFNEFREDENTSVRERLFLNVVEKIYDNYENILTKNNLIDFNDMINNAKEFLINNSQNNLNYKYLIIDEFQDINKGRLEFIKELVVRSQSKLFSVGDDWQSIYRFNGSDVSYFSKFGQYFTDAIQIFLPITYRFNQYIADVSSKFISKNEEQISNKQFIAYNRSYAKNSIEAYECCSDCIEDFICSKIFEMHNFEKLNFLILGRYKKDFSHFSILTDKFIKKKKLNLKKMSVHKAKGIEADVVFVVLKNGEWGFPNKVEEEKVMRFVLPYEGSMAFAEERRVFYVALTRAKRKVFIINLMSEDKDYSDFMKELKEDFEIVPSEFKMVKREKEKLYNAIDKAKNSKKCIRLLYKDNILNLEPCEIKRGFLLNDYEKNSVSGFEFNKVYVFFKGRKTPYDLDDLNFLENRNMSW